MQELLVATIILLFLCCYSIQFSSSSDPKPVAPTMRSTSPQRSSIPHKTTTVDGSTTRDLPDTISHHYEQSITFLITPLVSATLSVPSTEPPNHWHTHWPPHVTPLGGVFSKDTTVPLLRRRYIPTANTQSSDTHALYQYLVTPPSLVIPPIHYLSSNRYSIPWDYQLL